MKKKISFLVSLFAMILFPLFFTACSDPVETTVVNKSIETYTCPMHPQVVKNEPGICPVCGMDLVAFAKNDTHPHLTLGASQKALANVKTMRVSETDFANYTRLNGRLTTDPEQTSYVSARVAGRIETLYAKETGVVVNKGQALYKIYSEQLSTLQQEFMLAKAQKEHFPGDAKFTQIEQAARQKLLLYGQTDAQLNQLVPGRDISPFVTYYSPAQGVVSELLISEGQYVNEGGIVMKLEDYSNLWVEADLYPGDFSKAKTGDIVKVIVEGYENQPLEMKVAFINPVVATGSQILRIRGSVPNRNHQWQSGLSATVLLAAPGQKTTLTLPTDAVIRDQEGAHVWVESKPGEFEPRMVSIGRENLDQVEITNGLKAGEQVVIAGAYLLYSEFILKKGKDPMAGMNM